MLFGIAVLIAAFPLVEFVVLLLVAKPPPRVRLRERWRSVPAQERWIRRQRARVLEELRKREVLTDADSTAINQLAIGNWQELESLPDGRAVRNGSGR